MVCELSKKSVTDTNEEGGRESVTAKKEKAAEAPEKETKVKKATKKTTAKKAQAEP
jgi:hypothetical protein